MAEREDGGRKQRDNNLKAVSVVGRLQENIRAALEDKNRSTSLSCPQSGSALIRSKKATDVSDFAPFAFFFPSVITEYDAVRMLN